MNREPRSRRVFISYAYNSADHTDAVQRFWVFLRAHGVDARLDRSAEDRRRDWPLWMQEQVDAADFVLVMASPAYRRRAEGRAIPGEGRGVQFEASLLRDLVMQDKELWREKILPVLLPGTGVEDIPRWLGPYSNSRYVVTDYTVAGVEELLRVLTGQAAYPEPVLGPVPTLSPRFAIPASVLRHDVDTHATLANVPLEPVLSAKAAQTTLDQKDHLVRLLLAVPRMTDPLFRQQILNNLPAEVAEQLSRDPSARVEIASLVQTFEDFPHLHPWTQLIRALRVLAPGTKGVSDVAKALVKNGLIAPL
jgi:hypothetical protein